ncbi:uncharacterized protein N7479_001719 [Penicillium vulpinum]|uniref:uncharacterized protein n=1 Tax=Penicillium vulpinum TaxID=29845 RepID=UPI002549165F|nr:uncharacterized protein N7479_001719 [Penicillium vulpinum]KAJ5971801.1 hypothetical protein N7479_001719 [Penicillium vulpinum]
MAILRVLKIVFYGTAVPIGKSVKHTATNLFNAYHRISPSVRKNLENRGRITRSPEKVASTRRQETIRTGRIGQNITGIECISADGWVMHPWFLIRGSEQMEDWYDGDTVMTLLITVRQTIKLQTNSLKDHGF